MVTSDKRTKDKKASVEFREKLQAVNADNTNSIFEALQVALTEAIELEITTWVEPSDTTHSPSESDRGKPGYRMRTRINIVDGDIDNEVGNQFLNSGPYAELREFHVSQVRESRQIVQQNLDNLKQLVGVVVSTIGSLSPNPSARSALRGNSNRPSTPSLPPSN